MYRIVVVKKNKYSTYYSKTNILLRSETNTFKLLYSIKNLLSIDNIIIY